MLKWHLQWTGFDQNFTGRTPDSNVRKAKEGLKGKAGAGKNPLETFSLFIMDSIMNKIVINTNSKMEMVLHSFRDIIEESYKYSHYKITVLTEWKPSLGFFTWEVHWKWICST